MRKVLGTLVIVLAAFLFTGPTFAHGGKSHRLMGTVKEIKADVVLVTATDGHESEVTLNDKTKFELNGKPATKAALTAGIRVSIQLSEDDKTAVIVKIAPAQGSH